MQHMISGTRTINRSHQPCVGVTPPESAPSPRAGLEPGFPVRQAGALNRNAKATASSVNRLNTTFTGIHVCYIDIPHGVLTRHLRTFFLLFFVIFFVQSAFSTPRCRSHWLIQAIKSVIRVLKALILKTEHKPTLQSVAMLDCIERILIGREDLSHLG